MSMAMGMVAPTVKTPHGLSARPLTTTSASTARRTVMMARMAMRPTKPAAALSSSFSISAERFAIAADGGEEDDEILHRAAEHHADEDPERAGKVAELRGEHRPDERAGAGDGGEVMAEDDPLVRLHVIPAVLVDLAGRGAAVVQREHAGGDPFRVKAVADGVGAKRGGEDVAGIERLGAAGREGEVRGGAGEGDGEPDEEGERLPHGG